MKVIDHEPQSWFLLEKDRAIFLDANCNHSFYGYTFTLQLRNGNNTDLVSIRPATVVK